MEGPGDQGNLRSAVLLSAQFGRPRLGKEYVLAEPFHSFKRSVRVRERGFFLGSAIRGDEPEYILFGVRFLPEPDGQIKGICGAVVCGVQVIHCLSDIVSGANAAARRPRSSAASAAKAR